MNLNNKKIASALLDALQQIEDAKSEFKECTKNSYDYLELVKNCESFGMCLYKISQAYPNFQKDLRNFLDKEAKDIDMHLSKL